MYIVKCKIADFNVSFESDIKHYAKFMENYPYDFDRQDVLIRISDQDEEFEKDILNDGTVKIYPTTFKRSALFRKFSEWIPLHNAFVLHSAAFDVDGVGVAFAAHSGTGKTTHMLLWQKLLGERMTVVNGDKPIVRFFEPDELSAPETAGRYPADTQPGVPYAYGTPWNGKERLGCNMRTPLKHICFIERAEQNSCERMTKADAVNLIFNQVYMPKDPAAMANTIVLIDRLLSSCDLWKIRCNMDVSAAETAYSTIFQASR